MFLSFWLIILTIALSPTIAIILMHVTYYLEIYRKRGSARLPPGPIGWPILGSTMYLLKPHSVNTIGDFMENQVSKYGKVFTIGFAGERTVISTDPELSRFVLHNEMKLFENNPPKHMHKLFGDSLGFLRGDAYRSKKSVVLGFINSYGPQSSFLSHVKQTAAKQMSAWKNGDVVYMAEEASRFSFHLIVELVSGMSPNHPEIEQLRNDVITFHIGSSVIPINFPGTRFRQAIEAKARISEFFQKIIQEREDEKEKRVERDLIDRFMTNTSYTREEISESAIMLIFAGLYTTSSSLASAIYFLQNFPDAIEQMREEIQQFIKSKVDGKLTWADYKNMEFTQSVISESLRLGNVAPFLFKRTLKDIEFKGYVIPKGTPIMPHMASAHLDPNVFENPGEFNPWRWLGKDGMKKFDNWMPFGGGMRYCNGKDIARAEIAVFLSHLVLNYEWEPAEPDEPITSPMVSFPKGLPVRIRERDSGL